MEILKKVKDNKKNHQLISQWVEKRKKEKYYNFAVTSSITVGDNNFAYACCVILVFLWPRHLDTVSSLTPAFNSNVP